MAVVSFKESLPLGFQSEGRTMRGSTSNGAPSTSEATSGTTASTPTDSVVPTSPSQAERPARDSSWLELEVCRDFQRQSCPRNADTCRFAHPQDNPSRLKVTCCYDYLKVGNPRSLTSLADCSLYKGRGTVDNFG